MTPAARALLDGAGAADAVPSILLMRLLAESTSPEAARDAVASALRAAPPEGTLHRRLAAVQDLFTAHPESWELVRAVLAEADHGRAADPAEWGAVFDRVARISPEAGAALYGLGSPALLADATAEIVALMRDYDLLGPGRALLDLGCGYGRLSLGLAGEVGAVLGLDVSGAMIAEARRRGQALANVAFEQTGGADLARVGTSSQDVVLASDVFPYLVAAGPALAARLIAETARVLRPGGALLILNYSYRGDPEQDRAEAEAGFQSAGLAPVRLGTRDLRLWDARTYLGRRAG